MTRPPMILSSVIARPFTGPRGPQGLPGVGSAAWQPDHDYTEGSIVRADDGSWLVALADHTSGATLDEVELLNWTPQEVSAGSLTEAALSAAYSAKSAQETIESGRLEESVLSNRFGSRDEFIGAERLLATAAGIGATPIGGYVPVKRLAKTDPEESLLAAIKMHRSWAKVNILVHGCNVGAGSGNVFLRVLRGHSASGEQVNDDFGGGFKTIPAGAQYEHQVTTVVFGMAVSASDIHYLRVLRANDPLDTLPNDYGILGIEVQPTAFVDFQPELPELPEDLSGRTFTAEDSAALDVRVWHQSPPPASDDDLEAYKSYPITDAATLQDFTFSTWTGNNWAFEWGIRWNYGGAWNKRPNYLWGPGFRVGDHEVRAVFTSLEKAHAAMRARLHHLCGMSRVDLETEWETWSGDGTAADLIDEADAKADLASVFVEEFPWAGVTYQVSVDKVILPTGRLVDGPDPSNNLGVVLDYEVGDSRSEADTTAFIGQYAAILHAAGKQLFFYSNPLTNIVQQYHGVGSANLPAILDACDFVGVMLTSNLAIEGSVPSAYSAAITRLGPVGAEWEKVVIVLELGVNPGTTLDDAQWVYDKLHEAGTDHPNKLMFWRYWALLGGAPSRLTNQKISTACFGTPLPPSLGGGS